MNIENFVKELQKINLNPTKEQLESLEQYKNLLLEYNQKFNLTAIKTEEEIYLKHFYDSLTLTKVIDLNHELKVLDIGTGAGFPGLVLKIFFPNLEITLLDSNHKKITFLNEVIKELKLEKINCIHGRAEELNETHRQYFDIVTSRAVASLRILIELSLPFIKVKGYFLPMKGNCEDELQESIKTLEILHGKIDKITKFNLPVENSNRTILKIIKEDKTPEKYPRKYDQIIKKALK